jgi:tRNA 2-thiouridine synthesizing protein A
LMLLHSTFKDIKAGDVVKVLATDPSTQRDIPKFCLFLGHELLEQEEVGSEYQYRIRKGS